VYNALPCALVAFTPEFMKPFEVKFELRIDTPLTPAAK
jgi:hypothetical protein